MKSRFFRLTIFIFTILHFFNSITLLGLLVGGGVILHEQSKQIVLKLYKHFKISVVPVKPFALRSTEIDSFMETCKIHVSYFGFMTIFNITLVYNFARLSTLQ